MLLALAGQVMDVSDTALCQALLPRIAGAENDLAAKQAWVSQATENAGRTPLPNAAETYADIASRPRLLA